MEPLYQDEKIRVDYHPHSVEDHLLCIRNGNEDLSFILQRGVLDELANSREDLTRKLSQYDDMILYNLTRAGINLDDFYGALCKANAEEEDRMKEFMNS